MQVVSKRGFLLIRNLNAAGSGRDKVLVLAAMVSLLNSLHAKISRSPSPAG